MQAQVISMFGEEARMLRRAARISSSPALLPFHLFRCAAACALISHLAVLQWFVVSLPLEAGDA